MISNLLLAWSAAAGTTTWDTGPINVPILFPFNSTSAVSFTLPKSSNHDLALLIGIVNVVEYLATPEKLLNASFPLILVQGCRLNPLWLGGRTGPPFKNSKSH